MLLQKENSKKFYIYKSIYLLNVLWSVRVETFMRFFKSRKKQTKFLLFFYKLLIKVQKSHKVLTLESDERGQEVTKKW